jgi:hypothetical protein
MPNMQIDFAEIAYGFYKGGASKRCDGRKFSASFGDTLWTAKARVTAKQTGQPKLPCLV